MPPSSAESSLSIQADPPNCEAIGWARYNIVDMFYTYVLACTNSKTHVDKMYIGSSADLKKRLNKHKRHEVKTTKDFKRIKLIYYEACRDKTDARKRELQLKTGFGRGYLKRRLENDLKRW